MSDIKNKQDDIDNTHDEELVETALEREEECAQWQEKAQDFENKYFRIMADYQNLEKRMREDRIGLFQTANKELLLKFLPILDTLVLAQQHEENKTLRVLAGQFLSTIKAEGVTPLEVVGKQFDPATMEVITTQEGKEGVVIQEVRKGYLLHDRLLRPAGVIVGKKKRD